MGKIYDKILTFLMRMGTDLYLHILGIMLISTVVARVCTFAHIERSVACFIGIFAGYVAGLAKELYDTKRKGTVDIKDYIADIMGGAFFLIIYI